MLRSIFRPYLLSLIFIPAMVNGQLNRGSADFASMTSYQINGISDSIYIFYQENSLKFIEATLGGASTIDWYYYDEVNNEYDHLLTSSDIASQVTITGDEGYMVVRSGGAVNDTFRCWTIIDDYSLSIFGHDSIQQDGEWIKTVPTANKWCHLLRNIRARIDSARLSYYNPSNGEEIRITPSYPINRGNWSAEPGDEAGIDRFQQNDDHWLNVDVENPYWYDSWYSITITDQFGLSRTDSIFNETIEPHANFKRSYIYLSDSVYYPDRYDRYYEEFYSRRDSIIISAPALFKFDNKSVNAQTMTWFFGDNSSDTTTADSILHTYQLPGKYLPMLVVSSRYSHLFDACTDTLIGLEINVDEASILKNDPTQLPNVFSCPDGEHNIFRFINDVSITDFEIVIYNRYGKRVHHFEGNIRDWQGWDGHDKNSDKYVSTGVYYYVVKELNVLPDFESGVEVRLESFFPDSNKDEGEAVPSVYRGFVHVYNTE